LNCRFCKSKKVINILDLGKIPLSNNFIKKNDITHALNNPINQQEFEKLKWIMGNAQWTMDN
jgi:hypothetical protein